MSRKYSGALLSAPGKVYVSYQGDLYLFKTMAQLADDGYGGTAAVPVAGTGGVSVVSSYSGPSRVAALRPWPFGHQGRSAQDAQPSRSQGTLSTSCAWVTPMPLARRSFGYD